MMSHNCASEGGGPKKQKYNTETFIEDSVSIKEQLQSILIHFRKELFLDGWKSRFNDYFSEIAKILLELEGSLV